jgi:peroxiredoxin
VAVFGVGYLLSAPDPCKYWPVVAMGFVAKTGAFAGTLTAFLNGQAGQVSLALSVVNDLIWLAPFGLILWAARSASIDRRRSAAPEILRMALHRKTNYGVTLDELSRMSPVLLVFLRHAGCTFCREALADLATRKREIEENGTRLVLVHMGSEQHGSQFFEKYGLESVPQISDPKKNLYRAFGLRRGSLGDLFGPKVWLRGFEAAILGRHGVGRLVGDGFQMPGAFLLFHGEVVRGYRHQSAADRPDYMALVTGHVSVPQHVRR